MATSHVKFMVPTSPRTKEELAADLALHEEAQQKYEEAKRHPEVKDVVKLDIPSDDVGKFVGKGGSKVRDYVIKKTRDKMEGGGPLFCQIVTKEEEGGSPSVWARLKAKDEETLEKLKENLEGHRVVFLKMKRFEGQSRFVFKVGMEHYKIAKFIGARGGNIAEMKEEILKADINQKFTRGDVYIKIEEDRKFKMKNMTFDEVKACGEDIEQKVLITVSVYTDDRDDSLVKIRGVIVSKVNEINGGGGDVGKTELDEDEDPWGGDW
tara:strand:+ start:744 stop:1541 length:798 start_codon:yes stop_codon:yes gene_type:complete